MPVLSKYFAIARDLAILAALAFALSYLVHIVHAMDEAKNDRAVLKQIADNQKQEADWRKQQDHANEIRDSDLRAIHGLVAAHSEPVVVYVKPPAGSTVPGNTGADKGGDTKTGGGDTAAGGSTCDVRPSISQYEEWVESALADCRSLRDQWPK